MSVTVTTVTVEVARTYTVTLSEREAALVAYLVGAAYTESAARLFHDLEFYGFKSHTAYDAPGIILPEEFRDHLLTLSDRLG